MRLRSSLFLYSSSRHFQTSMSGTIKTDMIILHATASGNPALRDGQTGESFFIRELCDQLMVPDRRSINTERFILMFNFWSPGENILR